MNFFSQSLHCITKRTTTAANNMKLAFAIATVASLQQADVARADCDFGSNYTRYFNRSDYCSFEVAVGRITLSSTSSTTSSGDTNVTTYDELTLLFGRWAIRNLHCSVTQTSRLNPYPPHIQMDPHLWMHLEISIWVWA